MRTNAPLQMLNVFDGVHQVDRDMEDRVLEVHGLVDNPALSMRRIQGKTLATTGPGLGPVYNLHQLRFRETFSLVGRFGTNLTFTQQNLPRAGFRLPDPQFDDLREPLPPQGIPPEGEDWFIPPYDSQLDPPDWPDGFVEEKVEDQDDNREEEDNNPIPSSNYVLSYTPNAFSFSFLSGEDAPPGQILSIVISNVQYALILDVEFSDNLAPFMGAILSSSSVVPGVQGQVVNQEWSIQISNTSGWSIGLVEGFVNIKLREFVGSPPVVYPVPVSVVVSEANWSLSGSPIENFFYEGAGSDSDEAVDDVVTIDNTESSSPLLWNATENISWVSVIPSSGVVQAGQTLDVVVRSNPDGLSEGKHEGTILFNGNYGSTKSVDVSATVADDEMHVRCVFYEGDSPEIQKDIEGYMNFIGASSDPNRIREWTLSGDGVDLTFYERTDGDWILSIVNPDWPSAPIEYNLDSFDFTSLPMFGVDIWDVPGSEINPHPYFGSPDYLQMVVEFYYRDYWGDSPPPIS